MRSASTHSVRITCWRVARFRAKNRRSLVLFAPPASRRILRRWRRMIPLVRGPQQRETPPATIRRGYLDHDDDLRGGTRGEDIARLAGRVYAARAPRRRDAGV